MGVVSARKLKVLERTLIRGHSNEVNDVAVGQQSVRGEQHKY